MYIYSFQNLFNTDPLLMDFCDMTFLWEHVEGLIFKYLSDKIAVIFYLGPLEKRKFVPLVLFLYLTIDGLQSYIIVQNIPKNTYIVRLHKLESICIIIILKWERYEIMKYIMLVVSYRKCVTTKA